MTHLERLDQISTFTDDWNSYGAPAANKTAVRIAKDYLTLCEAAGVMIDRIVLSGEGGIGLVFLGKGWQADIEVFNDGDVFGGIYLLTIPTIIVDFAEEPLERFFNHIRNLRANPQYVPTSEPMGEVA